MVIYIIICVDKEAFFKLQQGQLEVNAYPLRTTKVSHSFELTKDNGIIFGKSAHFLQIKRKKVGAFLKKYVILQPKIANKLFQQPRDDLYPHNAVKISSEHFNQFIYIQL